MPRPMPSFQRMWDNYPLGTADQVKRQIGGRVDAGWITNTCVIRLSHAFNYAGDPIVRGVAGLNTISGADGKWYGYRVREMDQYLRAVYGEPNVEITSDNTQELRKAVLGYRGVIQFQVSGWSDATGHMDIWNGLQIRFSEHFERSQTVILWRCPL